MAKMITPTGDICTLENKMYTTYVNTTTSAPIIPEIALTDGVNLLFFITKNPIFDNKYYQIPCKITNKGIYILANIYHRETETYI